MAMSGVASAALVDVAGGSVSAAPGDGMFATGSWGTSPYAQLTYDVDYNTDTGLYIYTYMWSGPVKALSHILIEVSESFTEQNVFAGTTDGWLLDTFGNQGSSNPLIPDPLYSVKFPGGDTTGNFTIVSDRGPKWEDFYARDGIQGRTGIDVVAWNLGWGDDVAWTPGSFVEGKILAPDTVGGPPEQVPEPATVALSVCGVGMIGLARRRRAST